jgi:hypothetical protein
MSVSISSQSSGYVALVALLASCGAADVGPTDTDGVATPADTTDTVSSALSGDLSHGWHSTTAIKSYIRWCGGTSQVKTGLYEQTCLAVTGQEAGLSLFHYQVLTVFTARKGTHWIQVQDASVQTCRGACANPNTNASQCNSKRYALGGCATRSLAAGDTVTCVSAVAGTAAQGYIQTPSGPSYVGLVGSDRIGADGVVFYDGTPVMRVSLQSGCSAPP